jgi:hypothetical protein
MREGVSNDDNWERYDPNGFEILKENQKNLDEQIEGAADSSAKKTAGGVRFYESEL